MIGKEQETGEQMPRIDNSIDIKAPLDRVFQYIADPATHPDWVKWAKEEEVTSLERTGLGATSTMVMRVGLRKERVDTIVTEYKPDEFLTRRNTRGMEMTDRLAVLRIGDTTKVAWSVDYLPPMGALGRALDFLFMEKLFDQLMQDSLTNLKERLETAR
jgi:uncharacterized membrane protein